MGLAAFAKGIAFPITADLKGLKTGLAQSNKELDKTKSNFSKMSTGIQKHSMAIGTAMTGIGAAIVGLTDSAKKTNAALGVTAIQLGVSTEEMRDLALATTNVTFPLEEVQGSFDLLTRAGMENTDQIKATATAFDTLGDATGNSASTVTRMMIPAFNAFKIPLEDVGTHTDTMTHLLRNTTVEMSDFSSAMNYLSADLGPLGISMEDTVAILEAMADKGIQGSAATREFRTAVTGANGDVNLLYEGLGLTSGEVETYRGKLQGATGMTQDFADAANEQYGMLDNLKQAWSEWSLTLGSALEPLDMVGGALTVMGPMMMGLGPMMTLFSTIQTGTVVPALMSTAAAGWAAILPWLPLVVAIGGVIAVGYLLYDNWELITGALSDLDKELGIVKKSTVIIGGAFGWLSESVISPLVGWFNEAISSIDWLGLAFKAFLGPIGLVMYAMEVFGVSWEDVWKGMVGIGKSSINWLIGGVNLLIRGLNRLKFEVPDWVPLIGGQSIGFNLPTLPKLAAGGIITQPTVAMIGEAGPEAIIPLNQGNLGLEKVVITGNTFNVRTEQDIKSIAQNLHTLIKRDGRSKGTF
ncbi:MAG: phage tail tape measure protein [Deltaproteobacteria bacterium]|nr:phage tail tape measure protein [Deltaproteobacteria bacterium]